MHTKFADETKFWEGREALQKDLSELEGWMISSHTKFKKCKCQTLHLWRGNPSYLYRLTDEKLESSPKERNVGVLVGDNLNQSSNVLCPHQPKEPILLWGASGPGLPARRGEGLPCSAMCCCSTGCFGLGTTMPAGHKSTRECPNRAMQMVKGTKARLWRPAEVPCLFSPEEAEGKTHGSLQGSKGIVLSSVPSSDINRTRGTAWGCIGQGQAGRKERIPHQRVVGMAQRDHSRQWSWPWAARTWGASEQQAWMSGGPVWGTQAGLTDPCGHFPIQDILWFY